MKNIVIAPFGDNINALFIGIREFPTEKIILIAPKEKVKEAEKVKIELDKFKIPVQIKTVEGHPMEEIFRVFNEVRNVEKNGNIIVNVSTGDNVTTCAALSAAFVNGFKAFGVQNDQAMLLPVLKFSYYKLLTDKKMDILKLIYSTQDCCSSLEELSKKTKMSLPLISYHINGTPKSEGLKQLGLIESTEKKGKTEIRLTSLGRLLIKGYI